MAEDRCPPQAAFIMWPRSVQQDTELRLDCVKFRGGRRHRVTLHLSWKDLENEWWLDRYEERPWVFDLEEPGVEPF